MGGARARFNGALLLFLLGAIALVASYELRKGRNEPEIRPGRSDLYVVAHQDDDLLFMNPSLLTQINSGHRVRTIYLTAGDGGLTRDYWQAREHGALRAYEHMAGAASGWSVSRVHGADVYTLRGRAVSLVFLRLPDGNADGTGFVVNDRQSLAKLWNGSLARMRRVDASSSTTKAELIELLFRLIDDLSPDDVHVHSLKSRDHSDHQHAALFTLAAAARSSAKYALWAYRGYDIQAEPRNVTGSAYDAKLAAFQAYVVHDRLIMEGGDCSVANCNHLPGEYLEWLGRQYVQRLDPRSPASSMALGGR